MSLIGFGTGVINDDFHIAEICCDGEVEEGSDVI